MRGPNSQYNPSIDHMRAFAALLILYYHAHEGLLPALTGASKYESPVTLNPLYGLMVEGHTAVGLFMVLSGFIFTSSAAGRGIDYGRFMLNRFLRIYPLMIAVACLAVLLSPANFVFLDMLRTLFLFLKFPAPFNFGPIMDIFPWTSTFWTIVPEFQFYLIFPFLMLLLNRSGALPLFVIWMTALATRIAIAISFRDVTHLSYWTLFGRIDEFLVGMLIAHWWNGLSSNDRSISSVFFPVPCVVILTILLAFNAAGGVDAESRWRAAWPTIEGCMWGAFVVIYMDLGKRLPSVISRALTTIGEASYSIYLLHTAILTLLIPTVLSAYGHSPDAGLKPAAASFILTTFLLAPAVIAVSMITYRLIERPFLNLRVHYLRDLSPMAGPTAMSSRSIGLKLRRARNARAGYNTEG